MASDYSVTEVAALAEDPDVQLVDVRQPHEHEAGHIAGSTHIELTQLAQGVQTLDPAKPVILYCRSGGRSAMATEALATAGFEAHNMTGGMLDWAAAGLPMEPDDGFVAEP